MKRKLLASIIGIAASFAVTSAQAQGTININNYADTGPTITYGNGANKMPGVTAGAGIVNGVNGTAGTITWTVGFYYVLGTPVVGADPSGTADPATLGGGLAFATGAPGDTTTINAGPGGYTTPAGAAVINGYSSGLITMEMVAFSGASYNASSYRGHSAAFTLTPATGNNTPPLTGGSASGLSVFAVPEPSIFALSGLGAAALMAFRRKK